MTEQTKPTKQEANYRLPDECCNVCKYPYRNLYDGISCPRLAPGTEVDLGGICDCFEHEVGTVQRIIANLQDEGPTGAKGPEGVIVPNCDSEVACGNGGMPKCFEQGTGDCTTCPVFEPIQQELDLQPESIWKLDPTASHPGVCRFLGVEPAVCDCLCSNCPDYLPKEGCHG